MALPNHTILRDSASAFNEAIDNGYLDKDPQSPIYAGDYMYMRTITDDKGVPTFDKFKHIHLRSYLTIEL